MAIKKIQSKRLRQIHEFYIFLIALYITKKILINLCDGEFTTIVNNKNVN